MVAAIPLAFIIPAMCYIRLEDGPLLSRKKAPAVILAVFGTIVTIFGTIIIMLKVTKRKYLCALTVGLNDDIAFWNELHKLGIEYNLSSNNPFWSSVIGRLHYNDLMVILAGWFR